MKISIADKEQEAYDLGHSNGKHTVMRSPWVKTSDRLPEPWVTVLLWDGDEMVSGYANYDGDLIEHRWGLVFRATHWMLPEPPDEEGEG